MTLRASCRRYGRHGANEIKIDKDDILELVLLGKIRVMQDGVLAAEHFSIEICSESAVEVSYYKSKGSEAIRTLHISAREVFFSEREEFAELTSSIIEFDIGSARVALVPEEDCICRGEEAEFPAMMGYAAKENVSDGTITITQRIIPEEVSGIGLGDPCFSLNQDTCSLECESCMYNFTNELNDPYANFLGEEDALTYLSMEKGSCRGGSGHQWMNEPTAIEDDFGQGEIPEREVVCFNEINPQDIADLLNEVDDEEDALGKREKNIIIGATGRKQ